MLKRHSQLQQLLSLHRSLVDTSLGSRIVFFFLDKGKERKKNSWKRITHHNYTDNDVATRIRGVFISSDFGEL